MSTERHWLVWDGECGLCSWTAAKIRQRDPSRQFQIVTYQNCPRPPMDDQLYEGCKTAVYVLTTDGRRLRGADGVFFALRQTGSWWVVPFMVPPLVWLARVFYGLVARNRGWISKTFFGGAACGLDNRYPEVD